MTFMATTNRTPMFWGTTTWNRGPPSWPSGGIPPSLW